MHERIVLIGCGGIGSQLLPPLVRYLANRPEPRGLLVLVDGDVFEPRNLGRQVCSPRDLGTNKAEALAPIARAAGLGCQVIAEHLDERSVGQVIREGDLVLLAVDNHPTRALVDRHLASLSDATLISGGNDETDGNVQLVRRRDGRSLDGHLVEIHPEIGEGSDEETREPGCQVLATERPAAPRHEPDGGRRDAQRHLGGPGGRQRPVQRGLPRRRGQCRLHAALVPSRG